MRVPLASLLLFILAATASASRASVGLGARARAAKVRLVTPLSLGVGPLGTPVTLAVDPNSNTMVFVGDSLHQKLWQVDTVSGSVKPFRDNQLPKWYKGKEGSDFSVLLRPTSDHKPYPWVATNQAQLWITYPEGDPRDADLIRTFQFAPFTGPGKAPPRIDLCPMEGQLAILYPDVFTTPGKFSLYYHIAIGNYGPLFRNIPGTLLDMKSTPDGKTLYFVTAEVQNVQALDLATGKVSVLTFNKNFTYLQHLTLNRDGSGIFVVDMQYSSTPSTLYYLDIASRTAQVINTAGMQLPAHLALSNDGNTLYVIDGFQRALFSVDVTAVSGSSAAKASVQPSKTPQLLQRN